jgi:hypothetical protein
MSYNVQTTPNFDREAIGTTPLSRNGFGKWSAKTILDNKIEKSIKNI